MKKIGLYFLVVVLSAALIATFSIVSCQAEEVAEEAEEEITEEVTEEPAEEAEEAAEEAEEEVFKVAVSLPPANNAWQAKLLEFVNEEIAKDTTGKFDFTVKNAVDDADQLNMLSTFKDGGYDMMVILPGNGTLLTEICVKIFESGTKTLILDRNIDSNKRTCLVMGDNYGGGVNAANYIGDFLGGEGDIVVLRSYVGTPIDLERYNGFIEGLKNYPDIKTLVEGDGEFNREAGFASMTDILPAYPHIDGVYTQDDEAALGAYNAIKNENREDIKIITGFGGTKDAYDLIAANDPVYKASMSYFPSMGADGIRIAKDILLGESYEEEIILESVVVTSENVSQYMDFSY
jgi:ribose transport system substrate-binding protein